MKKRVVFDTNTIVSALIFAKGSLGWLRQHWQEGGCVPLVSRTTVEELTRVFGYPKFRLLPTECHELLADYLPYCEIVDSKKRCPLVCRDVDDQCFLDLAQSGRADLLVTGDRDLLDLAGRTAFVIETPAVYRQRILGR